METKKFSLAVRLIISERRLASLTDSKHLHYKLLAGCEDAQDRGRGGSFGESNLERELLGEAARQRERGRKGVGKKKRNLKWMNYLLQETIPDSLTLTRNIPNCNPWHFSHLPSVLSDFLYDRIPEARVIL